MLWYYIPPTEQQELLFAAGKEYDKGQVIKGKKRY
jgi:cytochrome c oxidase assembly protein subunit 15